MKRQDENTRTKRLKPGNEGRAVVVAPHQWSERLAAQLASCKPVCCGSWTYSSCEHHVGICAKDDRGALFFVSSLRRVSNLGVDLAPRSTHQTIADNQ